MSDIAFSLSPPGGLTITERWKSGGRAQQVEIILRGADLDRLRATLSVATSNPPEIPDSSQTKPAGTNAANWPAIAAYLRGAAV